MKPLPKLSINSYRPFQWTEGKMAVALDENVTIGRKWHHDHIRRSWILSRMLYVAGLRRNRTGFRHIAMAIGTSETRARMVFSAFLKRSGTRPEVYPRYCIAEK